MDVWEKYNIYKQCQLIIEFSLSNYSHYSPPSPTLFFALLYLSTLYIPWLEAGLSQMVTYLFVIGALESWKVQKCKV